MLYALKKMIGMTTIGSDGKIGKVQDVYFDNHRRIARYAADRAIRAPLLSVLSGTTLTPRKMVQHGPPRTVHGFPRRPFVLSRREPQAPGAASHAGALDKPPTDIADIPVTPQGRPLSS